MKVLRKSFELTDKMLGQNESNGTSLRYIKFLLSKKVENGYLLYNTLTGELLLIDDHDNDENTQQYLLAHWFMVAEDFDEYELAKKIKLQQRDAKRVTDGINVYNIFTTTFCNANCFYCYEGNAQKEMMTIDTSDAVIDFMLENRGDKDLVIIWYGGEPLVNLPVIDHICDSLIQRNIPFISEIISNTYLFTPEVIQKAKEKWNLQIVRVTIDGMNELYKKVKDYSNQDPDPLSRVLGNISMLIENGIKVEIRLHIDHHNIDGMDQLVDFICERYGNSGKVNAYIHLLYKNHERITARHTEDEWKTLLDAKYRLEQKFVKSGLLKYSLRDEPMCIACRADNDDYLSLLPDGKVMRCRDFFDYPPVGDVFGKNIDKKVIEEWKERGNDFERCSECEVYPQCGRLKLCLERQHCNHSDVYRKKMDIECAMLSCYQQVKKVEESVIT